MYRPIRYVKLLTEQSIYSQSTEDCLCHPTSEDTKQQTTTMEKRRRVLSNVFDSHSLLSDQLAQPEGTVDARGICCKRMSIFSPFFIFFYFFIFYASDASV